MEKRFEYKHRGRIGPGEQDEKSIRILNRVVEWTEEGMCGRLNKAMYGTRDAAQNWESAYAEFMESIGFTRGRASSCVFWHKDRELKAVVHGDDFTILGWEKELDWFKAQVAKRFDYKHRGRI